MLPLLPLLPPLLRAARRWRCSCAVVALDGGLWVLGGGDWGNEPLPTAERLSLATLAWTSRPPMREARRGCVAGALAGRVVAVGGSGRGGADGVLGSAEWLDPAEGAWEPLRGLRQARSRCGVATVRGGLYVMGGCGPGGAALASVERLDAQRSRAFSRFGAGGGAGTGGAASAALGRLRERSRQARYWLGVRLSRREG
ncbi:unnamed protein product [Prorocentrum cordatum]|uniref:Uncharacterized protein n=1 Tax=Prorocentrum cordatum TaxID=2364126 RepID=A0ABN9TWP2_9DINO|nr:unnamed protein product [Polarella glacialis]